DGRGRARADLGPLGVHAVLLHVLHADRRERADADVQRDAHDLDAALANRVEESRREVEAGRRRGDGALAVGEDGLIAVAVALAMGIVFGFSADVRGQRLSAEGAQPSVEVVSEAKEPAADGTAGDLGPHATGDSSVLEEDRLAVAQAPP